MWELAREGGRECKRQQWQQQQRQQEEGVGEAMCVSAHVWMHSPLHHQHTRKSTTSYTTHTANMLTQHMHPTTTLLTLSGGSFSSGSLTPGGSGMLPTMSLTVATKVAFACFNTSCCVCDDEGINSKQ